MCLSIIYFGHSKALYTNEDGGYCDAEGKMGFYYKESEILPPLPGKAPNLFFSFTSCFEKCREFCLQCSNIATPLLSGLCSWLPSLCPPTRWWKCFQRCGFAEGSTIWRSCRGQQTYDNLLSSFKIWEVLLSCFSEFLNFFLCRFALLWKANFSPWEHTLKELACPAHLSVLSLLGEVLQTNFFLN